MGRREQKERKKRSENRGKKEIHKTKKKKWWRQTDKSNQREALGQTDNKIGRVGRVFGLRLWIKKPPPNSLLRQLHPLWQPPTATGAAPRLVRAHPCTHSPILFGQHRHRPRTTQRLAAATHRRLVLDLGRILWLSWKRKVLHLHHVLAIQEGRHQIQLAVLPGKVHYALWCKSSLIQGLLIICKNLLGWRCVCEDERTNNVHSSGGECEFRMVDIKHIEPPTRIAKCINRLRHLHSSNASP